MIQPDDPRLERLWQDYPEGVPLNESLIQSDDIDYMYFCRFCDRSRHQTQLVMFWINSHGMTNNPVMCQDPVSCAEAEEVYRYRRAVQS